MRLDDACGAADVASGNGLGIAQVWIHPGRVIEKPSAQEPGRVRRVILAAGEKVTQRERRDAPDEVVEPSSVRSLIAFEIDLAVAPHVRKTGWRVWVLAPRGGGGHVV